MSRLRLIKVRQCELLDSMDALSKLLEEQRNEIESWNDSPPSFPQLPEERLHRLTGEVLQKSKCYDIAIAMLLAEQAATKEIERREQVLRDAGVLEQKGK